MAKRGSAKRRAGKRRPPSRMTRLQLYDEVRRLRNEARRTALMLYDYCETKQALEHLRAEVYRDGALSDQRRQFNLELKHENDALRDQMAHLEAKVIGKMLAGSPIQGIVHG